LGFEEEQTGNEIWGKEGRWIPESYLSVKVRRFSSSHHDRLLRRSAEVGRHEEIPISSKEENK